MPHDTRPLPIPEHLRYDDRVIRELEDALIHVWEFIPSDSPCSECRRIKDLAYSLIVARAKELDGR